MVQAFGALAGLVIFVALAGQLIIVVFPYVIWPSVAVAGFVGVCFFGRRALAAVEKERVQREAEEEKLRIACEQREELKALYSQVRNAYNNLFDAERRRSQRRIGQ